MEQSYSYSSYPDSGDSSPRSPPWENQNQNQNMNYKVKLMCSYGGKILPRPHDNQLCYSGGETKILSLDRTASFATVISHLSSLYGGDYNDGSFKYQLPGEDLDALISVTNDDDLDHMMHEYDRLYRASTAKPARMRIFLFPPPQLKLNHIDSFGSDVSSRSNRDRFVEALNSGPAQPLDSIPKPPAGWAKPVAVEVSPPPPAVPESQIRTGLVDRAVGPSDPVVNPVEFQRLQIADHQPSDNSQYRRKTDDNMIGVYSAAGDYYKVPEKIPQVTMPPQQNSAPVGYWQENHVAGVGYPAGTMSATAMAGPPEQQPMYMISGAGGGGVYHAPMMQSATGLTGQGYYQMQQQQRMASDVYRDQAAAYNSSMVQQQNMMSCNLPPKTYVAATYAETTPYAQMAYYTATAGGGVVQQPQQQLYSAVGPAAVEGGELRGAAGGLSQDDKMVGSRVPQTSL